VENTLYSHVKTCAARMEKTMSRMIHLWFALALLVALTACNFDQMPPIGQMTRQTRDIDPFDSVELVSESNLIITQGPAEGLLIEAAPSILPYITNQVRNGKLILDLDYGWWPLIHPTTPITFRLTVHDLHQLDLSGAGTIQAEHLASDHLVVVVDGSGSVRVDHLQADSLDFIVNGSVEAKFAGQVTTQTVDVRGSAIYQADELESQHTSAILSGSGELTVWAKASLAATVPGSGKIRYFGSPKLTTQPAETSNLQRLGEKPT
jgi:hypothetical protein